MSRSEFRYNKKRKHYSYLFKDVGLFHKNLVITSKKYRKHHKKLKTNVKLFKNPNRNSQLDAYIIPIIYFDNHDSFDSKVLNWTFDKNDKRKIKRLKKKKKV